MRLLIAQMKHETNTFSPVPTPIARFAARGPLPLEGQAAIDAFRGTGTPTGAFLDLAAEAGAEIVLPITANAWPSGPVEDAAFEHIATRIVEAAARGCDAILLDLHGAMVTQSHEDGEGELLRRLRAVAPATPIGVALDMHTNLFPAMVELSTVLAGYQTYPHVDMHATGLRAGRPILAMLEGRATPVMAAATRPMLPHVMRQSSLDEPNASIQARARQMEEAGDGVLAATFFVGFPHADVRWAGSSAVVVADGDRQLAQLYCDELLNQAWLARERFVYVPEPLDVSLERARGMSGRPVVLLDHYDNCASGGTMDTMAVLGAILDAGLEDVAAFAICDPEAAAAMLHAGEGATLTLPLGGKRAQPAIGRPGTPRTVTGTVRRVLPEGRFVNDGPMAKGAMNDLGPSAVLDTGRVEIAVISKQVEPHDIAAFRTLGIDPTAKRYLMLKSRVHWRAGLGALAQGVVECAGEGVCTSDYSQLRFERVRRPVYPLDPKAPAVLFNAPFVA